VSQKSIQSLGQIIETDLLARWHDLGIINPAQPDGSVGAADASRVSVQPLAEVLKLPEPLDAEHVLASVPLVRHWLFAPDGSKLRYREFRVRTSHEGRDVVQTIRIGDRFAESDTGYGVLKVRHQRALFGLQHLWQKQGGKLAQVNGVRRGIVCTSSWDLEDVLFGTHGGKQKRIVRALIQQLASIPVAIENYIGPDGHISDLDVSGLIAGAEFQNSRRASASGQLEFPWVEICFSSIITRAFEQSAVKPLNMRVLKDMRSDLSALLYPKADYLLSTNSETELRLDGLVEKLGLSGDQFHQPGYRLRKFVPVAEELNGQPLSLDGYMIEAKLVPTTDSRDHKLVLRRRKMASKAFK
jgi:hypothetical protein